MTHVGTNDRGRPRVSVIVAVYNEAGTIETCLRSLLGQTHPPWEVIVVDDGSSDATPTLAASFAGVTVIRQPHLGAAAARNRGARAASGDILVFFDGDSIATPAFMERLIAPMTKDPSLVGTFTKEILVANPERRWAHAHQVGRDLPPDRHFPDGAPDEFEIYRAIRREPFLAVGGFDEVGHGEDVTVGRKLGIPAVAAPGAVFYHHEPETLRDIFRTAVWYGRGIRVAEDGDPTPRLTAYGMLRRAMGKAIRTRVPSLLVYSVVWDLGVRRGWRTRRTAGTAK